MEFHGICLLILVTAVRAQTEVSAVTESLYYVHTPHSENILDMFSINYVPFLFYDYGAQTFVINGQVTDGIRELGQDEVDYYRERARGFQARLRGTTREMIHLTNSTAIAKKKPSVHIYMEPNRSPGHPDILYCYAEKFYPFGIELSFLVNGRPFGGQVNSSQLVVEPDWTFNILKSIQMRRGSGDTYACSVDHISLQQPLTVSLDPPPQQDHTGTVICAVGVIVGAVGFLIGLVLVIKIRNRSVHVGRGESDCPHLQDV
ncbi:RLA class II histocompatibility antigen, DP alpha-1 chain-like isoform X2 [Stegostoma tigrinum]|uniref:RLA class II histocompatibility antigen, DP alpha-1 chain-like isoform X2 n=1 Tax=Stegostoma tigrinum TaxID=3053191 RepID=UPI002870A4D0|nr:RLA class II histocompatibility antigen, DP alpha-1 chain-like isoform X2 [Stegostoma tigrinum]